MITFGRLASSEPLKPEQLTHYAEKRAGFSLSFMEICQKVAQLEFVPGDRIVYSYNTGNWPSAAGVAGYVNGHGAVGPALLATSLFLNWNLQATNENLVSARLLRCALSRMSTGGVRPGVALLIDLYEGGHCSVGALYGALDSLLSGSGHCESATQLVSRFFSGTAPSSDAEFINTELDLTWVGDESTSTPLRSDLIEAILLRTSESIAAARSSSSLNEWYVYQVQIGELLGGVKALQEKYVPNPALGLRIMISQWEEIRADGVGFQLACRAGLAFPSYMNLAAYALDVVGASYRGRVTGEDEWKDRLFAERLVIPSDLRGALLDGDSAAQTSSWERLSPSAIGPWLFLFRDRQEPGLYDPAKGVFQDPGDAMAYFNELGQQEHSPDAESELERATSFSQRFPYLSAAHWELGVALDNAKQIEAAINEMVTALVLTPSEGLIWQSAAVALNHGGYEQEARFCDRFAQFLSDSAT
ncbi:hypothetical protein [Kocuria arenosa]|uniref:hypothetical protein n=1 Tax=Kocuria arenosa TaxID=3071446 RepID=UPI0034D4D164